MASRPATSAVPETQHCPVASTFWQQPGRVDERVGQRLHRQGGQRPIGRRPTRQVGVVEPDHGTAHRSLRPEPVDRGIRPDDLAVGDPDLVIAGRAATGLGRRHPGVTGMPEGRVDAGEALAVRGGAAFLDAQPERLEPELGVPGEGEQLVDGGQALGQRGHLGVQPPIDRHRQVGGAIPQVWRRHRPDCTGRSTCRGGHAPGLVSRCRSAGNPDLNVNVKVVLGFPAE